MKRLAVLLLIAVSTVFASEYRGSVKVSGLPLPGATVTAKQGDRKLVTTTDDAGEFRFADLPDGKWVLDVEMAGFSPVHREVDVAAGAAAAAFETKLLSRQELAARITPANAPAPAVVAETKPTVPASAATTEPQPRRRPLPPSQQQQARQGQQNPNQPQGGRRADFQQVDVNQSADPTVLASDNAGMLRQDEANDLSQSAANSFVVQGSVSSAVGMPQQNDWGFRGGFGPDGMQGGAGMAMGMGGPNGFGQNNGDGPGNPDQAGGPAGRGGPGGPGGFGGGSGPGGPGGFGGPGGGGFGGPGGPGGFGGRGGGGFSGGRGPGRPGRDSRTSGANGRTGRPDWMARGGATSFGNSRRNQRQQYMGSLNFNLNNSAFDARTYSVTGATVDKPSYANARIGLTIGGPLRIPKLIRPERQIMFTFDINVGRNRTGVVSNPVNMPTLTERLGDFSQTTLRGTPVTIYDPLTGQPFPGNRIPSNRIDPAANALLKYFPEPNLPFAARNYQTSWSGSNNSINLNSRLSNIRIGRKDRLNYSFSRQQNDTVSPNLLHFIDTGSGSGLNTGLQWTHNFATRVINNAAVSFSRNTNELLPYFAGQANIAAQLGILGTSQNPNNWGPPNLTFTNYGSLSDGNFLLNRNQTVAFTESLLWIRGNKNFMFGTSFRRFQFNALSDANGRGTYSFNGQSTSAFGTNGTALTGTGWDFADFLLGAPATSSVRYGNPDKYFRGSALDLFANNDWRISSRFSLNMGVRWDYTTPTSELYNRMANLAIGPAFTSLAPVLAGQSTLINPDRNNISPRIGFAWRPKQGDSTVVRGGYGVYYNTSVYQQIAANMAQQPPFAQVLSVSGSVANPLSIQNGFLIPPSLSGLSTYAIDPNYRIGYAQTWQLSVQHDLPFSMFGTIGYLGTKGTRLDQQFLPNTTAPGAPVSPYPKGYVFETSNGNSIYHAAQFQLNRRFRNGFMANTSYQFSKSIDNAGTGGRGQGGTPVAQDWLNYSAERGLSSFDSRHNLSIMGQYSTAMGRNRVALANGWRGSLMKDWTISSVLTARSGNPFTAVVGGNRSQVAGTAVTNTVRASATGLPVNADGMLFNTAAFAEPLPGTWGNAGRNTIPGPTVVFLNAGIGRVIRLGERRSVDLQMQAQNVLNKVTITQWGTVLSSTNYGLATNAASMRRINVSLRFRF